MKDTAHRLRTYDFDPHDDGSVSVKVFTPYCLNNIGQRLTELMEAYRFYYVGLDAPVAQVEAYKRIVELQFPYSQKFDGSAKRDFARSLLNANFILNTMEIVTEELIEILLLLAAVQMAKNKTPYKGITKELHRRRKELLGKNFPQLIKMLETEVGALAFNNHLTSINQLRRTLVHRAGVVDNDQLVLNLYVPGIFAENTFVTLSNPENQPSLNREEVLPRDVTVVWNRDQEVTLDYELCFKILFTVISFFGYVVNKAIPLKHPEIEVANQEMVPTVASGESPSARQG